MNEFTHFDSFGNPTMVDVSNKATTKRTACAKGSIVVSKEVFLAIKNKTAKKGDVLSVASVAAIMGAKKTSELIPMCHQINLTKVSVDFEFEQTQDDKTKITTTCVSQTLSQTGVEMEALTGATIALLTIYDMCKAIDKNMKILQVYLESKTGGASCKTSTNEI